MIDLLDKISKLEKTQPFTSLSSFAAFSGVQIKRISVGGPGWKERERDEEAGRSSRAI